MSELSDHVPNIPPLNEFSVYTALEDVRAEITRQDVLARAGKFGGTHVLPGGPNDARYRVLGEEVGEVARALNEMQIQGLDTSNLYDELVQTAACAVAWCAAIWEGRADE
jgi:hypothetical protein